MKKGLIFSMLVMVSYILQAQPDRWQQRVKYTMNIDMNVQTNQFTGKQKLVDTAGRIDRFRKKFAAFDAKNMKK